MTVAETQADKVREQRHRQTVREASHRGPGKSVGAPPGTSVYSTLNVASRSHRVQFNLAQYCLPRELHSLTLAPCRIAHPCSDLRIPLPATVAGLLEPPSNTITCETRQTSGGCIKALHFHRGARTSFW